MPGSVKNWKWLVAIAVLILFNTESATAQISYKTIDQHNQLKRQSLKEAGRADVAYKDTHLNVDAYTFKKGEAARKRAAAKDGRNKYRFNENGDPAQPLPVKLKKKGLLFKRKKNINQK